MFTNNYPEHEMFMNSVNKFIHAEVNPYLNQWEKAGFFPNDLFQKLGDQGFLGILIPEELGGIGGDFRMAAAWCEAWGQVCAVGLVTGVNMHSLVITAALAKYGSPAAIKKLLPDALSGKAIGAYAFTEPGAGSDLASLITRAEKKGDRWILNGAKTFITNGARAHFVLVLAKHDPTAGYKGFTTFLVDTSSKGFSVSKKLDKVGWYSSDTAELHFENVEVPEELVLGQVGEGWTQAARNLEWERLMLAITSLAGARRVFKDALRYAKDRKAFGKRILDIPTVKGIFAKMYDTILLDEAITYKALDILASGKPSRIEVTAAKRKVCEDAIWVADRALQMHGGYGYTTEFSPERWWRDLRLMTIGGGTSEVMSGIIAKELNR